MRSAFNMTIDILTLKNNALGVIIKAFRKEMDKLKDLTKAISTFQPLIKHNMKVRQFKSKNGKPPTRKWIFNKIRDCPKRVKLISINKIEREVIKLGSMVLNFAKTNKELKIK
ncbi:hypothetical protein Goklo_029549, partial [Gossypium klotzschianum]|nr:hypothetical protein [Gossypium klotzschianum]